MGKLSWDGVGERIYETGVDHAVLYVTDEDGYGRGVPWNGLISVTEFLRARSRTSNTLTTSST